MKAPEFVLLVYGYNEDGSDHWEPTSYPDEEIERFNREGYRASAFELYATCDPRPEDFDPSAHDAPMTLCPASGPIEL